jgi:hypothetical protein
VLHHGGPRDENLDRSDRPRRSMAYSRNYTVIALSRFRGLQRLAFVPWWWLVGDRGSYGVCSALVDAVARRSNVWVLFRAAMLGKWMGLRAWLSK